MNDINNLIKNRRIELGLTQLDIAKATGVAEATVSRWESGQISNMRRSKIAALAKVLQLSPSTLMGMEPDESATSPLPPNILPMPKLVKKPRLGDIACGKPILAVEDAESFDFVPEDIECDFTLRCKGDSMINARIFDGDVVYIRSQPEVENGEIAAVRIGDEATLKKVYYTPGSDRITLRACNPMYADQEYEGDTLNEIEILGKAIAFTSTIRQ